MGVSWMRRSEYISAEYNRFIQSAEKAESRVGYHLKKMQKDEDVYKDRESQIAAIEKTFEDAKVPIEKHFNKPGVYALEVSTLRGAFFPPIASVGRLFSLPLSLNTRLNLDLHTVASTLPRLFAVEKSLRPSHLRFRSLFKNPHSGAT